MNERNGTAGSVTSMSARVVDRTRVGKVLGTHSKGNAALLDLRIKVEVYPLASFRPCLP